MRKRTPPVRLAGLLIEDFAAEGRCVAHHEGRVVFVDGPVYPGDVVDVLAYKLKPSYVEARVTGWQHYSAERATPRCEHFGVCGGCRWQHVPYTGQLAFKARQVQDALERLGHLPTDTLRPIIGADPIYEYRNKLEYSFSSNRWFIDSPRDDQAEQRVAGFHIPGRYDRILDIRHCHLQQGPGNAIRLSLRQLGLDQDWSFYDVKKHAGFLRNLVVRTTPGGGLMLIVQVGEDRPRDLQLIVSHLQENFPEITSLYTVFNPKNNDTFQDLELVLAAGRPCLEEQMEELRFEIGPKSFYQTNSRQALRLYQLAREMAELQGHETVYDLYTGTGTIACFVAGQAKKVVGIEYVQAAVADACRNAQANGIGNAVFLAGDMKQVLTADFADRHGAPDVVITDPPRAGMDEAVVRRLLELLPEKIVYVSCNPATQARDVALLHETYRIAAIQPVDMFPHTHHVENLMLLLKR